MTSGHHIHSTTPRSKRWGYAASLADFLDHAPDRIIGQLSRWSSFADNPPQKRAWEAQIKLVNSVLIDYADCVGSVIFEYDIPRLGKRADVILLLEQVIFVLEFKVGANYFARNDIEQVWDYALDLKNFHEPSHALPVVPILIATESRSCPGHVPTTWHQDHMAKPLCCGSRGLPAGLQLALAAFSSPAIDTVAWQSGRYCPTPTIVEAARALYAGHNVADISRNDAGANNIHGTASWLANSIDTVRRSGDKAVFFVTGVPGAGKTLVGLDIANQHTKQEDKLYSVYLSGNGPLVKVLHEALARDRVSQAKREGRKLRKGEARSAVKQFIQNVHHFRDDCLADDAAPIEHIALFDEAQRAWNLDQTRRFMQQNKGQDGFDMSEPAFLISCLDRHDDWAAIVCLVGNGQEINTGEAGIAEWLRAVRQHFPNWSVYLSPQLDAMEEAVKDEVALLDHSRLYRHELLHLATSVRSFRSENVSNFVNALLDLELEHAKQQLEQLLPHFPIRITRNLEAAKAWLQQQARGSERYGIVVSSQAQRLKPFAIDVRVNVDPVHWFLASKDDTRSSYYLEDVATEFQVQGLELDWTCVVWDGDLRLRGGEWGYFSFKGKQWQKVRKVVRQRYLLNAYRVLLTRARQGMVIVVPEGRQTDSTRQPDFYNPAYDLLTGVGIPTL